MAATPVPVEAVVAGSVDRRDLLRMGALTLLVGPVLAGCSLSNPAVDDPSAPSPTGGSGRPGRTPRPSASPTRPAAPGASQAAVGEQRLGGLATGILHGPHRKQLSGRQRTLLTFLAAAHAAHASVLAPGTSAQPADVGSLSLAKSLSLLARREADAGTAYGRAARAASGLDALLFGSLSVAAASYATVANDAKPPAVTTVRAHRPAALLSDVAAVQELVRQLHAMVYGYQLAIGRLPVLGKAHERAVRQLLEQRMLRDRLISWLHRRSAAVPTAEPAYVPSTVPRSAATSAKLLRQLQVALQPFCGLWVAAAAGAADREAAVSALASTNDTARSWGAPLTTWPGWS